MELFKQAHPEKAQREPRKRIAARLLSPLQQHERHHDRGQSAQRLHRGVQLDIHPAPLRPGGLDRQPGQERPDDDGRQDQIQHNRLGFHGCFHRGKQYDGNRLKRKRARL